MATALSYSGVLGAAARFVPGLNAVAATATAASLAYQIGQSVLNR